jgi:lipopolysaccharide export system ATP-binding protein
MSGLHVDSVRKDFGIRRVLNDVFLSCEVGEIVGLLGRNGSGKSSLLKIVFGSCAADYKFVSIDHIKQVDFTASEISLTICLRITFYRAI